MKLEDPETPGKRRQDNDQFTVTWSDGWDAFVCVDRAHSQHTPSPIVRQQRAELSQQCLSGG